jgi:transglutaminase-like putative cysteine protease
VPRYFVSHLTEYAYDGTVALARHTLHLTPRELPWQRVVSHRLTIEPNDALRLRRRDAFGNPLTTLVINRPHRKLVVHAESWLDVRARPEVDVDASPRWEAAREALVFRAANPPSAEALEASQFLFESQHVRIKRELSAWGARFFTPGLPVLAGALALTRHIHSAFEYDPEATEVTTPALEVLEKRRGVCQDFAHLMLSALRSLGLAARYVSGYLLTTPPPGKPRLIGADASHAWVAVWCPQHGWVEFDPTNGILAAEGHVVLGWGRDFADVTPLRGVTHGSDSPVPEIEVTVVPESEYAVLFEGPQRG